jgi:hypothetical protein
MSPAKPPRRPVPTRAQTALVPPPLELTPAEIRWVMAYRAMDQRRREENLDLAEADAMAHPRRTAPSMRLITGGTK